MTFIYGEWDCEACVEAVADIAVRHVNGDQTLLCEPCWREYVRAKSEESREN